MTLYEMAKQMIETEQHLDIVQSNLKLQEIANTFQKGHFYLLMNPDLRQYVFLAAKELSNAAQELQEIVYNRGQVLIIDDVAPGIWEIWLKDTYDGNAYVYQLCDYTENVVEV